MSAHRPGPVGVRRLLAAACAVAGVVPLASAPAAAVPVAAAAPVAGPRADCPARGLDPALVARLDRAVRQTMRQASVPGAVVGLWLPGRGQYVRAFGVADKRTGAPMRVDINSRIGSVTKTFTVTALLELVDQGRVHLDDPIGSYLHGVPDGDRITLRDLADMRSGLFPYSADPGFIKALYSHPTRGFTPGQLLGYAFRHPNLFAAGTQYLYSNTNTVLIGLVVEKITGTPLAEYLRRHVTGPSHLPHSYLAHGTHLPQPYAHGYTEQTLSGSEADATHWNPSWAWADGAMVSDLGDLRTWAGDLFRGNLLSRRTQAQRLDFVPTGIPGVGYGLGVFDVNGWIGHNGVVPGYETLMVHLPAQRATLVVLVNTDIDDNGNELSTLLGQAVTSVATPQNIFRLPAA